MAPFRVVSETLASARAAGLHWLCTGSAGTEAPITPPDPAQRRSELVSPPFNGRPTMTISLHAVVRRQEPLLFGEHARLITTFGTNTIAEEWHERSPLHVRCTYLWTRGHARGQYTCTSLYYVHTPQPSPVHPSIHPSFSIRFDPIPSHPILERQVRAHRLSIHLSLGSFRARSPLGLPPAPAHFPSPLLLPPSLFFQPLAFSLPPGKARRRSWAGTG